MGKDATAPRPKAVIARTASEAQQDAAIQSAFGGHEAGLLRYARNNGGRKAAVVDCGSLIRQQVLMNEHERGFLAFLAEPTRRRMETLLELGEKRRRDVRSLLNHSVRLDRRFAQHLAGSEAFSGAVEAMLRKRGASSTCYVLAASSDLDGREMPLGDALDAIIGMGDGAYVSCIPGRLGFYEYEDTKSSYLLAK